MTNNKPRKPNGVYFSIIKDREELIIRLCLLEPKLINNLLLSIIKELKIVNNYDDAIKCKTNITFVRRILKRVEEITSNDPQFIFNPRWNEITITITRMLDVKRKKLIEEFGV